MIYLTGKMGVEIRAAARKEGNSAARKPSSNSLSENVSACTWLEEMSESKGELESMRREVADMGCHLRTHSDAQ